MLSDQNTSHPGSMNETEFAETCLLLCPSSDGLAMRLYSQTITNRETRDDYVSIRQLSCILIIIITILITILILILIIPIYYYYCY